MATFFGPDSVSVDVCQGCVIIRGENENASEMKVKTFPNWMEHFPPSYGIQSYRKNVWDQAIKNFPYTFLLKCVYICNNLSFEKKNDQQEKENNVIDSETF